MSEIRRRRGTYRMSWWATLVWLLPMMVQGFLGQHPSCRPVGQTSARTASRLAATNGNKLWDRLGIEEDPEPFWYLLNCVAGLERDLLRQCRIVCEDMPDDDVIKFVVPTEKKTRSHGANRMVTETKSKYPGYVFGKLRLCPGVYEAIQGLDLCRSWMGTVQEPRGIRKLPPQPVALNELEVENFGLEDPQWEKDEEELDQNDNDIIFDDEAVKPTKNPVDQEALKVYLGLQVNDLVKVTQKGRFYDQDATVRRLKEGRILLRFFTYGTMFEDWMAPSDVRKLTELEVLNGLKGPTRPITQDDLDGRNNRGDRTQTFGRGELMQNVQGATGPRNRRQDRVERGQTTQVKRDFFGRTDQDRQEEEKNWERYKEQKRNTDGMVSDDEFTYRPGSQRRDNPNEENAQWGRPISQREQRRERQTEGSQKPQQQRQDWSSYVSPSSAPSSRSEEDDFFASLMKDLSKDAAKSPYPASGSSSGSFNKDPSTTEEDDFFASLVAEISDDNDKSATGRRPKDNQKREEAPSSLFADDFFASLAGAIEKEGADQTPRINDIFDEDALFGSFESNDADMDDFLGSFTAPKSGSSATQSSGDDDDFFASLVQEMGSDRGGGGGGGKSVKNNRDDFLASLEVTLSSDNNRNGAEEADDFFASLEDTLSLELQGNDDNTRRTADSSDKKVKKTAETASVPAKKSSSSIAPQSQSSGTGDLSKLTVPALKDMLRARGMKVSGNKAELIERLTA